MEDIALRFSLAAQLNRMRYGDSRTIGRDAANAAWPPTGNEDRSFAGAFRAMALASGGNRPEEDLTTEDRIRRDLDDSFEVEQRPMDGEWVIHRRLRACPHCRGDGVVRKHPEMKLSDRPLSAGIDTSEIVTVTVEKCEHLPSPSH